MKGRFVFAPAGIKCANQNCGRRPEFVGEGGWLEFKGQYMAGHHCPVCAQTYGVKWHYNPRDNFEIENLS